jgi:hypothetical protein
MTDAPVKVFGTFIAIVVSTIGMVLLNPTSDFPIRFFGELFILLSGGLIHKVWVD